MKRKVIMINTFYPDYIVERSLLEPLGAELSHVDTAGQDPIGFPEVFDADAILTRETKLSGEFMRQLSKCKVILRYGVGVDNIDLETAKKLGIIVVNVPDYGSDAVAEHALTLMLAATRRIPAIHQRILRGQYGSGKPGLIYSLKGKILGLIGTGRIGSAFMEKCKGLGFEHIIAYDPYIDHSDLAELVDLDTVFRTADFISLHTPLTPQTKHIIDKKAISQMKSNVVIINTARGGLINESDLVDALINGNVLAAGLDVFEVEPLSIDHPLMNLGNVVLTNHIGWYNEESIANLQRKAAEEIVRVFKGEQPIHWVNRP